jgi:hypothetical protein
MTTSDLTVPCFNCNGSGFVQFKHIEGGVCFRCEGTGALTVKAATTKQWGKFRAMLRNTDNAIDILERCGVRDGFVSKAAMSAAIDHLAARY